MHTFAYESLLIIQRHLVELRNEVIIYLNGKTEYIEDLMDKTFILEPTYAADILPKLN